MSRVRFPPPAPSLAGDPWAGAPHDKAKLDPRRGAATAVAEDQLRMSATREMYIAPAGKVIMNKLSRAMVNSRRISVGAGGRPLAVPPIGWR